MSQYQEMNCPSKAPWSVGKTETLQRFIEAHRKRNKPSVKVSPGGQEG